METKGALSYKAAVERAVEGPNGFPVVSDIRRERVNGKKQAILNADGSPATYERPVPQTQEHLDAIVLHYGVKFVCQAFFGQMGIKLGGRIKAAGKKAERTAKMATLAKTDSEGLVEAIAEGRLEQYLEEQN